MRFGVPRSASLSPEEKILSQNRFRAPTTYDSETDDDELSSDDGDVSFDTNISVASAEPNVSDGEEDILSDWDKLKISNRSPAEERTFADAVASVRSHSRYVDPYEKWQVETRRNAFQAARKHRLEAATHFQEDQQHYHSSEQKRLETFIAAEGEQFKLYMERCRAQAASAERQLQDRWKEKDRQLWERIEASIKEEEAKLREIQEAEAKQREAEEKERKLREEEAAREAEAARIAKEEADRQTEEKRRHDEADRLKREQEEKERVEREKEVKERRSRDEGASALRSSTGLLDCMDLWETGLKGLKVLKSVIMVAVKGPRPPSPEPPGYQAPPPPPLKKLWSAQRRKITPKIGQLTDDDREIARIAEDIKGIVAPIPNMTNQDDAQNLHYALLASFAKAVIAQAETEVTAHKAQAKPLARVAVSLIIAYPALGDIFWARLIARAGCWMAGIEPSLLENEQMSTLTDKEKRKRWGAREQEGLEEKMTRLSGVLRLYFHMLFVSMNTSTTSPLPPPFRPGRYWLYMSQLLNNASMLGRAVAAEIIYVGLEEGGMHAKALYGKQFIKMLQLIYECLLSEEKTRIGGTDVLAQASRARCLLEIEKIMG